MVTDPGSPLEQSAREAGYRVYVADPDVGGRYSALSAFGLVPSGLAGADIGLLLDEAEAIRPALEADDAGQPRAAARWPAGCRQPGRRRQGGARQRRLGVPGLRRLGGAADRGVHRQGRQGHPARSSWSPSTRRTSTPSTPDEVLATVRPRLRLRHASGPRRRGAPRSTRRWARRCCCGSTPPRWPAGCSGSTRSTSPTSRAPRRPPATMLEGGGSSPDARRSSTARSPSTPARGCCPRAPHTVDAAVAALLDQLDDDHGYVAVQAYLDRLPRRGAGRACAARWRRAPAVRSPSAGGRGSCTRPASTTRAGRRPASTSRSPATRRPTWRCPTGRSRSRSSSPPRPSATGRCWPTGAGRCCGCTSPGPTGSTSYARRFVTAPTPTRSGRRRTAACPGSRGRAGWCCSA